MNFSLVFRSLPEILIIFSIYFGCSAFLSYSLGAEFEVPSFVAGTIALSTIFGVYALKIFESASANIVQGDIEVSHTMGLSNFQIFRLIVAPQLMRYAMPGLGNLWLILLKDTVLISLIGGYDLMSRTQILIHNTQAPFKYYLLVACIYFCMSLISEKYLKRIKIND